MEFKTQKQIALFGNGIPVFGAFRTYFRFFRTPETKWNYLNWLDAQSVEHNVLFLTLRPALGAACQRRPLSFHDADRFPKLLTVECTAWLSLSHPLGTIPPGIAISPHGGGRIRF